eukprot:scaffold203151_cov20-Prasinocladus_malaysianus.AAC.1
MKKETSVMLGNFVDTPKTSASSPPRNFLSRTLQRTAVACGVLLSLCGLLLVGAVLEVNLQSCGLLGSIIRSFGRGEGSRWERLSAWLNFLK